MLTPDKEARHTAGPAAAMSRRPAPASPPMPPKPSARARPLPVPVEVMARMVAAALTAAMAAIHLHLWSTGYRHVHIIGVLFLLNGIIGIALAVALLAVPTRLLAPAAAATAGFTAGTLLGLILSLTVGLFGFKEFTGAPFLNETLVLESIGTVVSVVVAAVYARSTLDWWLHRRHGARK